MTVNFDATHRYKAVPLKHHIRRESDRAFAPSDSPIEQLTSADLLTWSKHFLPNHFQLPPSQMHQRLATLLDAVAFPQSEILDLTRSGEAKSEIAGSPAASASGLPLLPGEGRGEGASSSAFRTPPSAFDPPASSCPPGFLITNAGFVSPCLRGNKLNVIAPRGSAKSTLVTLAFVLREALAGRQPYIWIVSDTRHQAAAHLENIKTELTGNEELAKAYPALKEQCPIWRSGAIKLHTGTMIEAFGTGQRIRGRRLRHHRPTLIVCDDLQNDSHITSAIARDHSRAWLHGMLMNAGTRRTIVINIGTALHRECIAMELSNTPGWTSHTFRAIQEWPTNMPLWAQWEELYRTPDDRVADSEVQRSAFSVQRSSSARSFYDSHRSEMHAGAHLLWPEQEDLYSLMSLRAEIGRTAFDREKQSIPVNPDLCEWPEEYFGDAIWFDHWPADLRLRTLALDPSKGADARRGDYSAFVMLGLANDGQFYVEADLARRPTPQIVTDGVELCRHFRPLAFGIESNQFQELLGADFAAELLRQRLIGIIPCSIENQLNKAVRIRRLGPLLAGRRLRFKSNSPGTRLLAEQLREFPIAAHDDGPDALEMSLRLAETYLHPPPNDGLGNRLI